MTGMIENPVQLEIQWHANIFIALEAFFTFYLHSFQCMLQAFHVVEQYKLVHNCGKIATYISLFSCINKK